MQLNVLNVHVSKDIQFLTLPLGTPYNLKKIFISTEDQGYWVTVCPNLADIRPLKLGNKDFIYSITSTLDVVGWHLHRTWHEYMSAKLAVLHISIVWNEIDGMRIGSISTTAEI